MHWNFVIKADFFDRSPFYYSIVKGFWECTSILLNFINTLHNNPASNDQYVACVKSVKHDLKLIIKETPSAQLPSFINKTQMSYNY